MGADLGTGVHRAAVEPHAGTAGRTVRAHRARVGAEAVGRVLRGDAALQRRAAHGDLVLRELQVGQGHTGRDAQLRDHQIPLGDLLGDRVLDLDARVHLDEDVLARRVEQELDRARVDVADRPREVDRVGADPRPQLRVEVRRRRDLDDLLVPPLHRTVALVQMRDVAVRVGENLHLDVARVDDGLLQEDGAVAERRARLARGGLDRLAEVLGSVTRRMPRPPPPATALTKTGKPTPSAAFISSSMSSDGFDDFSVGTARFPRFRDRAGLVAREVQHVGRRPDEDDPVLGARRGEVGVLRQEAVARVHRVGAGELRRPDDLVDVEVGTHRVTALPDQVRLVGLGPVQRVAVLVREHRDGGDSQLVGGTERADRDLAPVGDQHLAERLAHFFGPLGFPACGPAYGGGAEVTG